MLLLEDIGIDGAMIIAIAVAISMMISLIVASLRERRELRASWSGQASDDEAREAAPAARAPRPRPRTRPLHHSRA